MSNDEYTVKKLKYSQREVDFILTNLRLDGNEVVIPQDADYLNSFVDITFKGDTSNKLYFSAKYCLVSDESIRWLKDDLRAALWFYSFLVIQQKWEFTLIAERTIFSKDLILSFDIHSVEMVPMKECEPGYITRDYHLLDKSRIMRAAFPLYNRHRVSRKDLNWLNKKDQEQMDWAIDYLQEKKLLINAPIFSPINTKESYAQVCASLDALDLHPYLGQKVKKSPATRAKNVSEYSDDLSQIGLSQERDLVSNNERMIDSSESIGENSAHNQPNTQAYRALIGKEYEDTSEAKKELLKNMRIAWNQKVSRDKKTVEPEKKLKLPHGYEKKLKAIADNNGIDMVTCLKTLIDKEYNEVKPER